MAVKAIDSDMCHHQKRPTPSVLPPRSKPARSTIFLTLVRSVDGIACQICGSRALTSKTRKPWFGRSRLVWS